MLATRCPQCGRPVRVSLTTPHLLRCHGCGYGGPPAPSERAAIEAAASILHGLDVHQRQLSEKQRRLLLRARASGGRLVAILLVALAPLSLCLLASLLVIVFPTDSSPFFAVTCASPFLFLSMSGSTVIWWARRQRRALERACAATPPEVEGDPASCHVCGGPLAAPELGNEGLASAGFVRCAFCAADNLIADDVLRHLGSRRVDQVADLSKTVRTEGTRLGLQSGLSVAAVVALSMVAPLMCLVSSYVLTHVVYRIEGPFNAEKGYVAVQTPDGVCLARVNVRYSDGTEHLILRGPRTGYRHTNYVPGAAEVEAMHAERVLGHPVHYQGDRRVHQEGRVVRVFSPPMEGGNFAVVELPDGQEDRVYVERLCFKNAPAGIEVLPWPESSMIPRGVDSVRAP